MPSKAEKISMAKSIIEAFTCLRKTEAGCMGYVSTLELKATLYSVAFWNTYNLS
jgi:GR25 family glycosyltransferase involved in LPS biosynthesis